MAENTEKIPTQIFANLMALFIWTVIDFIGLCIWRILKPKITNRKNIFNEKNKNKDRFFKIHNVLKERPSMVRHSGSSEWHERRQRKNCQQILSNDSLFNFKKINYNLKLYDKAIGDLLSFDNKNRNVTNDELILKKEKELEGQVKIAEEFLQNNVKQILTLKFKIMKYYFDILEKCYLI